MIKAAALIPAYNEADRIAATIEAARHIEGVTEVVVIDDGSSDETSKEAEKAGADLIVKLETNKGKGAALLAGIKATNAEVLLMIDADLASSASAAGALLQPVISGSADMTIAVPKKSGKGGGFGFAVGLARWGIAKFTGQTMSAPISGQRALKKEIIEKIGGFDPGFGVETGLTIDAIRRGYRVQEVDVDFSHRAHGKDLKGFLHRGKQFVAIARSLSVRALGFKK